MTAPPRRRAADRRRGLRVLSRTVISFALLQLVGGLLLDTCCWEVRFPEAGRVFARAAALDRPPDIACMGSSRFAGAVRPDVVDPLLLAYTREGPRTFNASVAAGDAIVAERLLDRMIRADRRPALLVVEVSPEHLSRHTPLLSQQVYRQMTWADLPDYLPDVFTNTHPMRLVSSRLMPLYFHRYSLRRPFVASEPPVDPPAPPVLNQPNPNPNLLDLPAAVTTPPPAVGQDAVALPVFLPALWLRDSRLSPAVTAALARLLDRGRAAGITVVLVGAPVTVGHRALYTPDIDAAYLAFIHGMVSTYGCRFVDFRDRIPDHGFRDVMHLNGVGSWCFSHTLAREVLIPVWRELHP
jgi:hypothetical protein